MVSSAKETKFKPAYNPYTEPSMEVFGYHPQLKKLIEVVPKFVEIRHIHILLSG